MNIVPPMYTYIHICALPKIAIFAKKTPLFRHLHAKSYIVDNQIITFFSENFLKKNTIFGTCFVKP